MALCWKLFNRCFTFWVTFLYKKYLLVGASSMLWTGQWMSRWASEWVRDVCISHQSYWIYYKQPIKFLFVNVKWHVRRFDPDTVQNCHINSSMKEEEIFIYWVYFDIFCRSGLVMDKTSLEVWNSVWASCMQMDEIIYKGNLIVLFFTKSKFNLRSPIVASSS